MITLLAIFGLFITVKASDISEIQVQTVQRGENVTIQCGEQLLQQNEDRLVWYKQSFGKVPQYLVRKVGNKHRWDEAFYDSRISISVDEKRFSINIAETREEDLATYFCVQVLENSIHFKSGTLLVFQAEETNHQAPTLTVFRSGESDTLQCSVQVISSSCADEQSVYWFKHGTGESHGEIIYTEESNTDQCKRGSEADFPTQRCVYTLPRSNMIPNAGIYYCAVAACGKILFGNGTKVDVKGEYFSENINWKVIVLTTSNLIFGIIIVGLVGLILTKRKGAINSQPSHTNQTQTENCLHYAAVSFAKKPSSFKKPSRVRDQDIYAQVKIN